MRVAQALADSNHDVTLTYLSTEPKDDTEIHGYYGTSGGFKLVASRLFFGGAVLIFANTIRRYFVSPIVHRQQVKREKPDLVYSRLTLPELLMLPRTTPLVYEMHSPKYLGGFWAVRTLFLWILSSYRQVTFVVTTGALEALLQEEFPMSEIVKAPLSADLPLPKVVRNTLPKPLVECGNPGCLGNVGYTGFVDTSDLRGIGTILELAELMPNVCFHIVGGGSEEAVKFWKSESERRGLTLNTHFYGRQNPSEIPSFLNNFEVVLSPLRFRPTKSAPYGKNASPLKIPQYLAYGKAIVASNIPAHREYLVHRVNALLVGERDFDSWCHSIRTLLENPETRFKMGYDNELLYWTKFTHLKRVNLILDRHSSSVNGP